jgi:hypothetical protein
VLVNDGEPVYLDRAEIVGAARAAVRELLERAGW